jgi:energy-coupling factor transport system substrate-specific component
VVSLSLNPYRPSTTTALIIIVIALAFNIIIGFIARRLQLPVYLDTVGIFVIVILLGWKYGLIAALISITVGSLDLSTFYFFYTGTAIGIVLTIEYCRRRNWFGNYYYVVFSGILVAFVSAVLSAPVTFYLQAKTATGNDIMTEFFRQYWSNLAELLSGLSSEPVDKVFSALIACWSVMRIPSAVMRRYSLRPITDLNGPMFTPASLSFSDSAISSARLGRQKPARTETGEK